jgi:predicted fused transcriptional regulator/phosphomethylpyrimidine kinase/predicted transcriptional regulator
MDMHPPCELMVDTFLPSMRALVARRLKDDGLSQGRIASLLGLTQASVSSYLSTSNAKQTAALSSLGVTAEEAETYAALLAEDLKNNPTYAVATLYSIWSRLIGGGDACARHRSEYPFLATCDVCMKVFGPEKGHAEGAVEHVESALRSIEGSSLFVHVMPEVSVNVAYAPDGAKSVEDVVAIPGRIVRVRGQARSFMRPEYGASTHLAAILLEVERKHPSLRAAINLRHGAKMSKILSKLRVRQLTIGHSYPAGSQDKVLGALRARLSAPGGADKFEAVVDLGGEGVEPSLYLFAEDAVKVVRKALEIARAYTSSG